MNSDTRNIVVFVLIGILAGWLASIVVGGGGLLRYLITGVIGSFVGGYLLNLIGVNLGIRSEFLNRVATATIGAVVVVLLARILA
ncbi:MAG: GlsB/YeaQ/YmgE family stress response membrane protein [Hyphomicrobiaceae bacterium]|jgi:uncharacterized membrane protein YeaQ/YmgE (transglycosylase-associated protein family)